MTKIFIWILCLFVVIAILKTNGVNGRPKSDNMMQLRSLLHLDELSEEQSEERRVVSKDYLIDYKAHNNEIGADRFDCSHVHNSLKQKGVCILPLPEAIAYCNADSECTGVGITTNVGYHKAFDLPNRMLAAELFKGTKTVKNGEWTLYVKQ